jgi:hypothetical protein
MRKYKQTLVLALSMTLVSVVKADHFLERPHQLDTPDHPDHEPILEDDKPLTNSLYGLPQSKTQTASGVIASNKD